MKILFKIFIIFIVFILIFVSAQLYIDNNPRINHMDSSVLINMNFGATNYSNINDVTIYVNTTVEGSPILNMQNYEGAIQMSMLYIGNNTSDVAKNITDFRGNLPICILNKSGNNQDINISNLNLEYLNSNIMFGVNITANQLHNTTHIVERYNTTAIKGYYAPKLSLLANGNSIIGSLSIKLNHKFIYIKGGNLNSSKVMQHVIYLPNNQKEHLLVQYKDSIGEAEIRINKSLVVT